MTRWEQKRSDEMKSVNIRWRMNRWDQMRSDEMIIFNQLKITSTQLLWDVPDQPLWLTLVNWKVLSRLCGEVAMASTKVMDGLSQPCVSLTFVYIRLTLLIFLYRWPWTHVNSRWSSHGCRLSQSGASFIDVIETSSLFLPILNFVKNKPPQHHPPTKPPPSRTASPNPVNITYEAKILINHDQRGPKKHFFKSILTQVAMNYNDLATQLKQICITQPKFYIDQKLQNKISWFIWYHY